MPTDQAFYGEYFTLPDYFADPKTGAVAKVVAEVLKARLVDTVREKLGLTYTPMVGAEMSEELQGEGSLSATIETPEANFGAFHNLLAGQLKDLASTPVSGDELARARKPLVEAFRKKQETNAYWVALLSELTREPRAKDQALAELGRISSVSATDVQAFAAKFLASRRPLIAVAKAAAAAQASTDGGATSGGKK